MSKPISDALNEIQQRCEAAGLEHDLAETSVSVVKDGKVHYEPTCYIIVDVLRGRGTASFIVEDGPHSRWAANTPFETYRMLKGYDASWSAANKVIECSLKTALSPETIHTEADRAHFIEAVLNILSSAPEDQNADQVASINRRVYFDSPTECILSVGASSDTHALLNNAPTSEALGSEMDISVDRPLTLRIEGVKADTHDDALEILERGDNSLLFHIDSLFGLPLVLDRQSESGLLWDEHGLMVEYEDYEVDYEFKTPESIPPVRFEYDRNPMSLYWYAKTASEMPLLQFLAYYQVIEFYFPVYSEIEAQTTLRNVLKEPTFNPMRDSDIARLLEAIKVGAGGRTFGNEASQLEATVRHCVTAEDLRDFLIADEATRYKFYTSDNAKKLVRERIPVREESDDHRSAVAKRVYAIRNRIVHTKEAYGDREPLFPFDPEVKHLQHDIDLVEFLARKVLIASSRPLQN